MKRKRKLHEKKQDFMKICKGAYHFGCDIGCDTSNCVTESEKAK